MQRGRAVLLSLAALLSASPANSEPYSWRGMADALGVVAEAFEAPANAPSAEADPQYGFDLRRFCSDDLGLFTSKVAAEDCADGDCGHRRAAMARDARGLAEDLRNRLNDPDVLAGSGAAPFVPPGLTLMSAPTNEGQEVRLRAAHDLWLRAWTDPLQGSPDRLDRDRWLILSRVWCDMTRDNALAARAYVDSFGFSPEDPAIAPAIIDIAIHSVWDPALPRPLHELAEAAFSRNQLHGYYAAQLADIDAMASSATQHVGTLFSCENGVAYPDPPLSDPGEVEAIRRRYGLRPLAAYVASRSRSCPTE